MAFLVTTPSVNREHQLIDRLTRLLGEDYSVTPTAINLAYVNRKSDDSTVAIIYPPLHQIDIFDRSTPGLGTRLVKACNAADREGRYSVI